MLNANYEFEVREPVNLWQAAIGGNFFMIKDFDWVSGFVSSCYNCPHFWIIYIRMFF